MDSTNHGSSGRLLDTVSGLKSDQAGIKMHCLISDLYPICRSITGNGVRLTHKYINQMVPLTTYEVPSGTKIYDWNIPKEWNINNAYILDPSGDKILDFEDSNLHVLNYSIPVDMEISLQDLKPHLYTLPEKPDAIPYFKTYYEEDWGFCLSHNQLSTLKDGIYHVVIDSTLEEGSLTYSECYLPGETEEEVLISCYTCHPSLCNDNLSGVAVVTFLAKYLSADIHHYSYRFLFIPETIGAIAWLSYNESHMSNIKHGLVVTCAGDKGACTFKKSRRGDSLIDRAVVNVLKNSGEPYEVLDFYPWGSDERQFCSPGFDLPIGCFMRTPPGVFSEYHNSMDNLEAVTPESLEDSLSKLLLVIDVLENNKTYLSLNPKAEPQLGARGLYRNIVRPELGQRLEDTDESAILWVLNLCDGFHSLLDISERSDKSFSVIKNATQRLLDHGLLSPAV